MNLRKKLILCFGFIATFSVALTAVVAINSATQTIKDEVENTLNSIIDEKLEQINTHIVDKEREVAMLANLPVVSDALEQLPAAFVQGIDSSVYLAEDEKVRFALSQLKARLNGYDLFLISPNGDIVFTVVHESDFATNLKTGAYRETQLAKVYQRASSLLETKISLFEPYAPSQWIMQGQEIHSAFIAAPVFKANKLLGVLAIQINSDDYYHLASDYSGIKHAGEVVISKIIDNHAVIIAPLRHTPNVVFNMRYLIGSEFALPIQWSVLGKKGSGLSIGNEGTEILAAWRYIPELQWGMVVKIEAAEAFATATKLKRDLVYVGIFVLMLAALIANLFSRQLSEPLIFLIGAVRQIAQGNLNQKIKLNSSGEVGQLTDAFNEMVIARTKHEIELKTSYQQLQKTVSEFAEQKFAMDQHCIVAITDVHGTIVFANDKFSEISGYSNDELIGQNHRILKSGHHDIEFFRDMYRTISNGKVWQGEICNQSKDGQLYCVDTTIVPFMGDNKKPKNYISIRTDITARKQTEIELINARNVAEMAVLAKTEFLACMSHEIRTPMNGVLGMLGLLRNTQLDDEQLRRVTIAQSSAQSLLKLINDILDFSKVEAGKLELETIDFDLRSMLGDFADVMAFQAQEKDLEFILDVRGVELSIVKGDPGRLRQILTNLVNNAIKFTSEGEVIIRVNLKSVNEQQLQMHCSIIDTGIGIPSDKQAKLFDSFTQVDASTTRKYGGTGLGLAIVKKLCELMGGSVAVSSENNKGSCFDVKVLLEKSSLSQLIIPEVDMKNLTCLIVDDNATNREVLRGQLEHWGASVEEAVNGQQALLICEQRVQNTEKTFFDIAFLDMQMPAMDGAELGKKLKVDDRFSCMKLIMMTSMSSQGDALFFSELGFSGYFPKPATTSDLFDALSVVAEGGEALQQAKPLVTHDYLKTLKQKGKDCKERGVAGSSKSRPDNTRLLVVEDNQVNQLVAKGILEFMGLQTDIVDNGLEALNSLQQTAENQPYSLVLMDCQMPEMDGYEATREIRAGKAGERNKLIPIIAMTANAMEGDREKCLQAGMSDYLTKPIDHDLLKEKLQHWLPDLDERPGITEQAVKPVSIDIVEAELAVWDKKDALDRVMNNQELLTMLIGLFVTDIPARISKLEQAIEHGDCEQIGQLAHAIKGVAANLSGLQLQRQSYLMEVAGKKADMSKVCEILPGLLQASDQLMLCFGRYNEKSETDNEHSALLLSNEELAELLKTLGLKLKQNMFIDQTEFTVLSRASSDPVVQSLIKQFQRQASQFSNDTALSTLTDIAYKTNIKLNKDN